MEQSHIVLAKRDLDNDVEIPDMETTDFMDDEDDDNIILEATDISEQNISLEKTKTLLKSIYISQSTTENLVKVQFWDCGGQAGFYGTHHPFLSYRSLYLLLFDASRNIKSIVQDEDLDPSKRGKRSVSGMA